MKQARVKIIKDNIETTKKTGLNFWEFLEEMQYDISPKLRVSSYTLEDALENDLGFFLAFRIQES